MKKRILVIDDEEILTKTFNLLLEKRGYEVYTSKNGQDALVMIEEEKFDLIICDMRMPGRNGVETIKAIRNSSKGLSEEIVPVIFVSGYADQTLEAEAHDLKPLAYIYKPFETAEILKTIEDNLKQ